MHTKLIECENCNRKFDEWYMHVYLYYDIHYKKKNLCKNCIEKMSIWTGATIQQNFGACPDTPYK
jgi:hypothetical protein